MIKDIFIYILIVLAFALPSTSCKKKYTFIENFNPSVQNGITIISANDFEKDQYFGSRWSAPRLSSKKKFFRAVDKRGELYFYSIKKEDYSLNIISPNINSNYSIKIKNRTFSLTGKNGHCLINRELINSGKNTIEVFTAESLRINNVVLVPQRLTPFNNKNLINQESTVFAEGYLEYYIKAENGQKISISFDSSIKVPTSFLIISQSGQKIKKTDQTLKDSKPLIVSLIPDCYQKIKIIPKLRKRQFLKITNSVLIESEQNRKHLLPSLKEDLRNKNFLLVLFDAARADRVSSYGYSRKVTPHIDDFFKDGILFTNTYSEASYTLASTGTLLTGLPPDYHKVISKFHSTLDPKITTIPELFQKKGYHTAAITSNPNFSRTFNYDKGFKTFIELFETNKAVLAEDFNTPFKKVLEQSGQKKFFIYLHIREPHEPFIMPPPFLGRFQNTFTKSGKHVKEKEYQIRKKVNNSAEDLSLLSDLYDENYTYADSVFKNIISILKEKNFEKDTVVIFLSDHGEGLGEHNLIGHSQVLFKEGIHIPLSIKIPGKKIGKTITKPVITSDLVRTISSAQGFEYPYYNLTKGEDLAQIRNNASRLRITRGGNSVRGFPRYSVEQYPYKLIIHFPYNSNKILLYDLSKDPDEKHILKSKDLIQKSLLFYLSNHLKNAKKISTRIKKPELRKKDLENLKTLGYL